MADRTGVLYADTSALVKLAVQEAETRALRAELERWDVVATSVISEIELARAVSRARERGAITPDDVAVQSCNPSAFVRSMPLMSLTGDRQGHTPLRFRCGVWPRNGRATG